MARTKKNLELAQYPNLNIKNGVYQYIHQNGRWESLKTKVLAEAVAKWEAKNNELGVAYFGAPASLASAPSAPATKPADFKSKEAKQINYERLGVVRHTEEHIILSEITEYTPIDVLLRDYLNKQRRLIEVGDPKALTSETFENREKYYLPKLLAGFDGFLIGEITPKHVMDYLELRKMMGAPISGDREIGFLSAALAPAVVGRILPYNPCSGVKRNELTPKEKKMLGVQKSSYVDDASLKGFCSVSSDLIAYYSELDALISLRTDEMLRITDDRECAKGYKQYDEGIYLRDDGFHVVKPAKGGKPRIIEHSAKTRELVEKILVLQTNKRTNYLFESKLGARYTKSGFSSMWRRYMDKAVRLGMVKNRYRKHDLRGKAATDAANKKMDAAGLLGDNDKTTNDYYIHQQELPRVPAVA